MDFKVKKAKKRNKSGVSHGYLGFQTGLYSGDLSGIPDMCINSMCKMNDSNLNIRTNCGDKIWYSIADANGVPECRCGYNMTYLVFFMSQNTVEFEPCHRSTSRIVLDFRGSAKFSGNETEDNLINYSYIYSHPATWVGICCPSAVFSRWHLFLNCILYIFNFSIIGFGEICYKRLIHLCNDSKPTDRQLMQLEVPEG